MLAWSHAASAQNWSFDARSAGLGGAGGSDNIATQMIEEQRDYRAIVLPFGLLQMLRDFGRFDPRSEEFDPVQSIEFAASPVHLVIGRGDTNSGQAAFVRDIRNAELSRDLRKYQGFTPA